MAAIKKGNMAIHLVSGEIFTTKRSKIDSVYTYILLFLMYYYQNHFNYTVSYSCCWRGEQLRLQSKNSYDRKFFIFLPLSKNLVAKFTIKLSKSPNPAIRLVQIKFRL